MRSIFGSLMSLARYFTLKDRYGHPRWTVSLGLYMLAGLAVAFAFLSGTLFGSSPQFERTKTRIKAAIASETVDPVAAWDLSGNDEFDLAWQPLETNNLSLERVTIPTGGFAGGGGSIVEIGTDMPFQHILFVTPKGRIGYLAGLAGEDVTKIEFIDVRVPMRMAEFEESSIAQMSAFNRNWLRTMDSTVRPLGQGRYELFVTHHRYEQECLAFSLSRIVIQADAQSIRVAEGAEWETVWQASPCLEMKPTGNLYSGLRDGGRLAWTPEGRLLISVGDFDMDGDNSPIDAPSSVDYDQGKIHELDLATGESRPLASGFRNPQGLVVTRDGRIFETEHGPNGGDEINLVEEGVHYGWPQVTLGMAYGFPRRDWPSNPTQGRHDGFTPPVFAFVPSVAIGAITEVTSPDFPDWKGDLLAGSLDTQSLFRLRRSGDEIIYSERIHIGERIRDIAVLDSGPIALLTDSARIVLIRPSRALSLASTTETAESRALRVAGYETVRRISAEQRAEDSRLPIHPGRVVFESKCASCHAISSDEVVVGPSLHRLRGRPAGSVAGYPYSDALADASAPWNERRLQLYLSDPDAIYPGTAMPRVAMTYPEYLHISWWIMNCTSGRDRPECHTNG